MRPQFEDGQAVDEQPSEPQPVAADQLVGEEELGISDEHAWEEVASDQHAEDAAGRLEEVTASGADIVASDAYSEERPTVDIDAVAAYEQAEYELAEYEQAEDQQAEDQQAEDQQAEDQQAEDEASDEHADDVAGRLEKVAASDAYSDEQPTVEIAAVAEDEQTEDEPSAEELTTSEEQTDNEQADEDEAALEQLPEEQRAVDAESIASELIAPELIDPELIGPEPSGPEPIGAELVAEEEPAEEEPALQEQVAVAEHQAAQDETAASSDEPAEDDEGGATELAAKADQVVTPPSEYGIVEGWYLDTAEDPVVPVGAVASPEGNVDWNWHWNLDETEVEQPEVTLRPDLETAPQTSSESALSSDDNVLDPNHYWSLDEPDTIEEVDTTPGVVDGWLLYIDRYPEVHSGAALSFEDEELDGNWDGDFDSLDARQDSVVVGADEEVDEPSDESQPTPSANGVNHQLAPEIHAEEQAQNGAHRPVGNGQGSNGRVRQKARSRNRRRRSRIK